MSEPLRCPVLICPWVYRPGTDDPAEVDRHLAEHSDGIVKANAARMVAGEPKEYP